MSLASRTNIEFGRESLDYSTQARADFSWPAAGGRSDAAAAARAQRGTAIVVGYDTAPALSESHAAYVAHAAGPRELKKVSSSATSIVMGTDASRDYSTSYGDGFPVRAVTANIAAACKEATLRVNQAHFSLGEEPGPWESSYAAGLRTAAEAAARGPSDLELRMDAKRAAASERAAAAAGDAGTAAAHLAAAPTEAAAAPRSRHQTSNFMPSHDVAAARTTAVNPNRSAGMHGDRAAAVMAALTTHGKPLSAVAFGYEAPEYVSTTMHSSGETTKTLKEPYVPKLVPKYVKEHPVLAVKAQ